MTNDPGVPGNADQQALLQQLQAMLDEQQTNPTMTPEQIAQAEALIEQSRKAKASADAAHLIAQLQAANAAAPAPVAAAAPASAAPAAAAPVASAPAAAPVATAVAAPPRKRGAKGIVIGLVSAVAALALIGAGLYAFGIIKLPGATVPGEGEVFLIAAADQGPDPFSAVSLDPDVPEVAESVVVPASSTQVPAATPGMYGGSGQQFCNPAAQANFLASNPAHAAAWVQALTTDPAVRLQDGSALTTSNITEYLEGLTPSILIVDTRVTNHGFSGGRATVIPAVLQAGTSVLVDEYGIPRVKCNCGNPLAPAVPISGTVTYSGTPWPGWNGSSNTVQPATEPLTELTYLDVATGQQVRRPVCVPHVDPPIPGCLDRSQLTAAASPPAPTSTPVEGADFSADMPGFGTPTFRTTDSGNSALNWGTAEWIETGAQAYRLTRSAQVLWTHDGSTVASRTESTRSTILGQSHATGDCAVIDEQAYSHDGWTGTMLIWGPCTNAEGVLNDGVQYEVIVSKGGDVVIVTQTGAGGDRGSFASATNTALSSFQKR